MTAPAEVRAEILKLAKLLRPEDEADLQFLERCSADELYRHREQVVALLYDDGAELLRRAAAVARILPVGVLARIAQHAPGPTLNARLAGFLDPELAAQVAQRLEVEDLARLATEIDPRRAADVITVMPIERIRASAEVMVAAGEHVAIGRFVPHLSSEALRACVEVLDARDLLLACFVLEGKESVDAVVACLSDERAAALATDAGEGNLQDELAEMLAHLGEEQRNRVLAATR